MCHIFAIQLALSGHSLLSAFASNRMLKTSITDVINITVLIFCCCIVCRAVAVRRSEEEKLYIDSVASLTEYKGCTEIKGNLIINIRGSGSSGLLI